MRQHATKAAVEEGILPGGGVALHPLHPSPRKTRRNSYRRRKSSASRSSSKRSASRFAKSPRTPAKKARSSFKKWPLWALTKDGTRKTTNSATCSKWASSIRRKSSVSLSSSLLRSQHSCSPPKRSSPKKQKKSQTRPAMSGADY